MHIALQHTSARHPAAPASAPAAMHGITLEVQAGEHVAVIGPSGAGKTTLLHTLACALQPSAGTLLLDQRDPWALPRAQLQTLRGQLFLAPQVPPLPPRQRVVAAVLAGSLPRQSLLASLQSLFYPSDIGLADAALARFDLSDKLFERVDRLSGGERQRVGLARALVAMAVAAPGRPKLDAAPLGGSEVRAATSVGATIAAPGRPKPDAAPLGGSEVRAATSVGASLILVDEPLSALDPTRAVQAITSLTGAAREKSATLVATLHHVEMALQHFPRIIGLRAGALAFDLPAAQVSQQLLHDLYAQHLHELTGPAPELADLPASTALPAVMHCR